MKFYNFLLFKLEKPPSLRVAMFLELGILDNEFSYIL